MHHSFTKQYRDISKMPLVDVLRLIRTLNVGPITFFHLIERFGTAAKALEALPDLSMRGGRAAALRPSPKEEAEKEIEKAFAYGARMIAYGDPDYPALLHAITDAPPIITVVGHPHLWKNNPSLAMVGSRNASAAGCAFAQKLAKELSEEKLVVTSGLARGIDSFAHRGALAQGTVAVIAGGIDNIYPPENETLYNAIRETGAIISEQPFGGLPYSGSFPGRNRIISGMSIGTVVVEASPRSGSLITAKFALEQGREVFAVPGSPLDPRARGCNGLIKDGAIMVESVQDIIQNIAHLRHCRLEERKQGELALSHLAEPSADDYALDHARERIAQMLGTVPISVDTLIEQSGLSASCVQSTVVELELAGRLERVRGNRVVLSAGESLKNAG